MTDFTRRSSLMAQPPRPMSSTEIRRAFSHTKTQPRKRSNGVFDIAEDITAGNSLSNTDSLHSNSPKRRAPPSNSTRSVAPNTNLYSINETTSASDNYQQEQTGYSHLVQKNPRRRTIFIPDDTTVMTIHPGHRQDETTISDISMLNQRPLRGPRQSLSKAPKRFALQPDHSVPQVPNFTIDRAGQPTGKENMPPGIEQASQKPDSDSIPLLKRRSSHMHSLARVVSESTRPEDKQAAPDTKSKISTSSPVVQISKGTSSDAQGPRQLSRVSKPSMTRKYPVIEEDIYSMAHYEDNWIANQEIVLTEILNRLFNAFNDTKAKPAPELRKCMLVIYQGQEYSQVMRRLKSSLNYGVLALPKTNTGAHSQHTRYLYDIGIRNKFIKLWTTTYDPTALTAALESITGRQVPTRDLNHQVAIEEFIETFFLLNEDATAEYEHEKCIKSSIEDTSTRRLWARTMHRCLGLVLLLDRAKQSGIISGNLFQINSKHKTSQSVYEQIINLLRGSSIDAIRSLNLLGYQATHFQDIKSEYDYTINNIAVDFRDGIRLGKLVEIIQSPVRKGSRKSIRLSTGIVSDLKFTTTTRTVKKLNVEKVLEALRHHETSTELYHSVLASEIVDGHREKTIALLWSIVSQFGVGLLVNWKDLGLEIRKLQLELCSLAAPGEVQEHEPAVSDVGSHQQALQTWTSLLCKKHGIPVKNFSTSFSCTPSPFTAIVKEYLPYMANSHSPPKTVAKTIKDQLEQLGCGSTFSTLFSRSTLFDKEFVLTTLAFLASRVLTDSRENRHRRAVLKTLAEHSAQVVGARNGIESAVKIIQRSWRAYVCRKNVREEVARREEKEADIWLL